LDSKQFHINVLGCKNVTFQHVTIIAPETSPNTDGIHIGCSTGIHIINSNIGTGDDCVSLGDGSRDITVEKVTCGPGHGISIGSLGKYPGEEPVSGVKVIGCTLTNTMTGVRIKTWPDSHAGTATDMHFEDIIMNNVGNPIIIDQVYCPWNQCKAQVPISYLRFNVTKLMFKIEDY
jgi:galacturan 1,4-alpha-galacturonidase